MNMHPIRKLMKTKIIVRHPQVECHHHAKRKYYQKSLKRYQQQLKFDVDVVELMQEIKEKDHFVVFKKMNVNAFKVSGEAQISAVATAVETLMGKGM